MHYTCGLKEIQSFMLQLFITMIALLSSALFPTLEIDELSESAPFLKGRVYRIYTKMQSIIHN